MTEEPLFRRRRRREAGSSARIDVQSLLQPSERGVDISHIPPPPEPSPRQIMLEDRAAVLAWYEPSDILDRGDSFAADDHDIVAILTKSEIILTIDGPRRRLRAESRRAALKRMKNRSSMQATLAGLSVSSNDPIQKALRQIVLNESIAVETLSQTDLAAFLIVLDWFEGILEGLPAREKIRVRLAREDFLAPLRRLAAQFVGREAELDRLRGYVGEVPQSGAGQGVAKRLSGILSGVAGAFGERSEPRAMFVHGIGGVGKSTLLSSFALEHADLGYPFVFLDLDRPNLDPRSPSTLLAEASRQLGAQMPAHAAATQKLAEDFDSYGSNLGATDEAVTAAVASPLRGIEHFCAFLNANVTRNLLLVIDTFEDAQALGDSAVYLMQEMLGYLQREAPMVRAVVSGRVLPDQKGFPAESLHLTEFDVPSAERFLGTRLADMGSVPAETISVAVRSVERTPLALSLAAELIRKHGLEAVRSPSFLGIVLYTKDAAFLYNRTLDHVPPGPLRKLAKPGLVLRRLSPAIIKDVLAEPCGLGIGTEAQARALFLQFSQQVSLVELESADILRHRSDVRRLMLPALEREVGRALVRTIDLAAVAFHERSNTAMSRAEELYHRLRLSDIEGFEQRWREDAIERLRGAFEDFAGRPEAYVALSLKLDLALEAAALAGAKQAHWERGTETRVASLLREGAFDQAIKILRERPERVAASALYRQEAEALMGLSRFAEALDVAKNGAESAQAVGDVETEFENAYIAARATEALGDRGGAEEWLNRATASATRLGQAEKLLRTAALRLRLEDWATTAVELLPSSLQPLVQGLLRSGAVEGAGGTATLRALGAASGGRDKIGRTILRRLGVERLSENLLGELATLLARNASGDDIATHSTRAVLASANKDLPPSNASAVEWKQWIGKTSATGLGNALAELSQQDEGYASAAAVGTWIEHYFRDVASSPASENRPVSGA
jgi:cellulose synthase operon protein C